MADQANKGETDEEWAVVVERRPRANSNVSNASAASDDAGADRTKASLRNERRRRRRAAAAAAAEDDTTETATPAAVEAAAKTQLRGVEKRLKSIRGLAAKGTLDAAETQKLARRDGLEAARAALAAVLAGLARTRAAADAVMGQLDDVQVDDAYECACCREVLELPVKLPCGHEFCRECTALVASRAKRPSDVVCPLCRAPFYDGATRKCTVVVAEKTRRKLKRTAGQCHCGTKLPLAGLRDHLRTCGAAAVYFAPRSKLGHELCPAPDFSGGGAAPLASSPTESSLLADALLRRFRHVAPERPDRPAPAPEPAPEATPEPRRRRQRWRRLEEATPEPEAVPRTPEARPAWGAAPAAAPPAANLRALLATAETPPPRAPKRASRAAAVPVSLAAFLREPQKSLAAFLREPQKPAPAPWLGKPAAPRARPSPVGVADIMREERAAKGSWVGVAR